MEGGAKYTRGVITYINVKIIVCIILIDQQNSDDIEICNRTQISVDIIGMYSKEKSAVCEEIVFRTENKTYNFGCVKLY